MNTDIGIVTEIGNRSRKPPARIYRSVSIVAGAILLLAAFLKAQTLTSPSPMRGWTLAQVGFEWLLGLWLCSGTYSRSARWAAMTSFGLFAGWSAWSAVSGKDSCGCFGEVTVHPLVTAVLNLLLVGLMATFAPSKDARNEPSWRWQSAWGMAAAISLLLGAIWLDPTRGAQASLDGASVINALPEFEPAILDAALANSLLAKSENPGRLVADLGYVRPDSIRGIRYLLMNPTDSPLEIRDIQVECPCTSVYRQPTLIPARGSAQLDVIFHAPKQNSQYTKHLTVRTASEAMRSIHLQVSARIGLPLRVAPAELDLGTVKAGDGAEGSFEVINEGSEPIRLLYSTSPDIGCYAPVPKEAVKPGEKISVVAILSSAKQTTGDHSVPLRLATGAEGQSSVQVTLKYHVP